MKNRIRQMLPEFDLRPLPPNSGKPESSQYCLNLAKIVRIRPLLLESGHSLARSRSKRAGFSQLGRIGQNGRNLVRRNPATAARRCQILALTRFRQSTLLLESGDTHQILTIEYENLGYSTVNLGYNQTPMFDDGKFSQTCMQE
jgi:hypothetical protein